MIYRSKDVNGIDEKEYLCNYCDCQSFKDESKYHEHLLSHMFKCEECDFYSMTRFEILNHVHYSHPSRAESILSTYWVKQNGQERYSGVSGFIDNEHSRNKQLKNVGSSNASYDTNQSADKGRHFQAEEALKEVSSTKPQPSKGNTFQKGRKKSKRYHLNVENKQLFEPINYSGPIRPNDGEKLTNGYKRNAVITNSSNIASDEINDGMFEPDMTLSQNSSGSFDSTDSGCSSENVSTSSESFDDSFQVFDEMLCENKTKSPVEQKEKTTTSSYRDSQGTSSFKNVAVAKLHNNFQSENHNSGIDSPNQSSRTTSYCKITSQTCPKRSSEVGILEGLDKPDVGSSKGYVKDNLDEIQNKPRDGRTSDVLNLYHPGSSGSFHDTKSDDEDETTSDPNPSESSYESSSDELVIDESHDDTDINSTYFSFTSRHLQTTNKDDAGFSAPKNVKNVDDHSGKQLHSRLQTNGSHYSAHPFANDYSLRPQMKDVKISNLSNLRDNFSPRSPRSVSSQEKNDLSFPSINSTNSRNFLIERSMKMLGESKRPKRRNDEASDSSNTKKKKIE